MIDLKELSTKQLKVARRKEEKQKKKVGALCIYGV